MKRRLFVKRRIDEPWAEHSCKLRFRDCGPDWAEDLRRHCWWRWSQGLERWADWRETRPPGRSSRLCQDGRDVHGWPPPCRIKRSWSIFTRHHQWGSRPLKPRPPGPQTSQVWVRGLGFPSLGPRWNPGSTLALGARKCHQTRYWILAITANLRPDIFLFIAFKGDSVSFHHISMTTCK